MQASEHHPIRRFLRRLQLHSVLADAEQLAILNLRGIAVEVAAGRDIVRPLERTSHASLVAAGNIGRYDLMRNGTRQITAIYISGDMCDLYAAVAPMPGWGLTSLGPSTVLQVAHADLRDLAVAYPNLALAFWRDTVLDASILAKWVANVGRKDARARISHLFCELGMRMERAGLGERASYPLALTQDHIGDAMGLTPVHVNRTLRGLKEEGLAWLRGHLVTITDWDRLVGEAEFSSAFLLGEEQKTRS